MEGGKTATRDRVLKQWATKIIANLPTDEQESWQVLRYAIELNSAWMRGAETINVDSHQARQSTTQLLESALDVPRLRGKYS